MPRADAPLKTDYINQFTRSRTDVTETVQHRLFWFREFSQRAITRLKRSDLSILRSSDTYNSERKREVEASLRGNRKVGARKTDRLAPRKERKAIGQLLASAHLVACDNKLGGPWTLSGMARVGTRITYLVNDAQHTFNTTLQRIRIFR